VAKSVGITVHEFALGMGPKLFSFRRGETVYALRLVPIGGFVMMEGEDEESSAAGSFGQKKVWQRILVVSAGAAMNILLGFFILLGLSVSEDGLSSTTIARFSEGAVSSQMLMENDRITHVNGTRVHIGSDLIFEMLRDSDGVIDFTVLRDGERVQLKGVAFNSAKAEDGTNLITLDFKVYAITKTPGNVLKYAWYWTTGTVREAWASLLDLITGKYGLSQLSGPVGVTSAIGEAAGMGLSTVLSLLALITINIGVFNLLPVPALDGGRLVFLLIEALFRRRVPPKYEAYVHAAGLIALFGLMIVVTVGDIARLF
jgi:regulator of sigma E protease